MSGPVGGIVRYEVDRGLVALFGGETRVRTLAPLANASTPLTAYRVAVISSLPRTKVYAELNHLAKAGVVVKIVDRPGVSTWVLKDPDIRSLLRRKVRIGWSGDLAAAAPSLAERSRELYRANERLPLDPKLLRGPYRPRNPRDFFRSPEKDVFLAQHGLKISNRGRRR